MRIARVIGVLTISRRLPELRAGRFVVAEVLDAPALEGFHTGKRRTTPAPEALVVYDEMGAGVGQVIAVSEGAEATMPFQPQRVPIDAYASAILDEVQMG